MIRLTLLLCAITSSVALSAYAGSAQQQTTLQSPPQTAPSVPNLPNVPTLPSVPNLGNVTNQLGNIPNQLGVGNITNQLGVGNIANQLGVGNLGNQLGVGNITNQLGLGNISGQIGAITNVLNNPQAAIQKALQDAVLKQLGLNNLLGTGWFTGCTLCREVKDVNGIPVVSIGFPPGKQCCNGCTAPTAAIRDGMDTHRKDFLMGTFWLDHVRPALQGLSTEISAKVATQTATLGTFKDAQTQLTAQRSLQRLQAQAIKDYTPSEELCTFGTLTASLSESDLRSDAIKITLSEMALARNLGTAGNASAAGSGEDFQNRIPFFIKEFCDVTNNNYSGPQTGLTLMCGTAQRADFKFNRDIDYARTIDQPRTLRVDFLTSGAPTNAEKDVDGLLYNLYGHKQMTSRMTASQLKSSTGQRSYMLERSIVARRMLAQNSLNSVIAMKAQGGGANAAFLQSALIGLGLSSQEAIQLSGANPSYFSQMDILTKRLYQTPSFYVGLMDKPANIARQTAAMEALGLMQDRDLYRSVRRSEMLLATLLELSTREAEMKKLDKVSGQSNDRTAERR